MTFTCIGALHTLSPWHKRSHPEIFKWQAPLNSWQGLPFWTYPAEILSPSQEHLGKRQIFLPDTQWCHCCSGLQTHWMGNEKLRGRYATALTLEGTGSRLLHTKNKEFFWIQPTECLRELLWFQALSSNNKKILILLPHCCWLFIVENFSKSF